MQNFMLLTLATLAVNCGLADSFDATDSADVVDATDRGVIGASEVHVATPPVKPKVLYPLIKPCMQDDGKAGATRCYPVLVIKPDGVDEETH